MVPNSNRFPNRKQSNRSRQLLLNYLRFEALEQRNLLTAAIGVFERIDGEVITTALAVANELISDVEVVENDSVAHASAAAESSGEDSFAFAYIDGTAHINVPTNS